MSTEQATLSWVQTLSKDRLIDELQARGIKVNGNEKFDFLRKNLREIIREEVKSKVSKTEKSEDNNEKLSDIGNSDSDTEDTQESDTVNDFEMADNVKLEFRLHQDDWETFTEQMEQFFITRDTKDEKKAAHL